MKRYYRITIPLITLSLVLLITGCGSKSTTTSSTTSTTPPTTVSGSGTINVYSTGFQPSAVVARAGTTMTFNNNMSAQMTLVGVSGFMGMGSFGGMMMNMGGSYQYIFNTPGVYVVGASGQGFQCVITVIA